MCSYSLTSICTFSRFHYFQKMGITFTSVDFIHSEHRKTQTIVITTKNITWDNCKELMSSQKFQFVSHSKKGWVELTNQSQKEVKQSLCNKFQTQFKIYIYFCCNCSGNYREAYALVNSFGHKKMLPKFGRTRFKRNLQMWSFCWLNWIDLWKIGCLFW